MCLCAGVAETTTGGHHSVQLSLDSWSRSWGAHTWPFSWPRVVRVCVLPRVCQVCVLREYVKCACCHEYVKCHRHWMMCHRLCTMTCLGIESELKLIIIYSFVNIIPVNIYLFFFRRCCMHLLWKRHYIGSYDICPTYYFDLSKQRCFTKNWGKYSLAFNGH